MAELKAEDLVKLIKKRYMTDVGAFNRCVVLEQVPDGTGMMQSRWIDVAVFEMWPMKGLTRSAFEVKVSRGDFIAELSNSDKHKWCKECFHYFWFVAPKDVVQMAELPNGIGWMYPRGDKLCVARHAVKNDLPKLDDYLLAGFMRAAHKQIKKAGEVSREEVLANSENHQRAKQYMEATCRFLRTRGASYMIDESVENVIKALEDATMDKQLKQDREHLLSLSGRFQHQVAVLFNLFAIIAQKSLLARNEMGELIVKTYGGADDDGLDALKEILKDKKAGDYRKRYAEMVELIMSWENL